MILEGRRALVTGAQQGIGRATAVALAQAGADVAVNWHDDRAAAEETRALVEKAGRACVLLQADLTDLSAIDPLFDAAEAGIGPCDILVNNAGMFPRQSFLDLTPETWEATQSLNLRAATFCTQAAARRMIAAGTGGAVVNIASMSVRGSPRGTHYSASKGGMLSMTRAAALELAPHGVRVNAVAPGVVDTAQPRAGFDEEQIAELGRRIPVGRIGRPEEIAAIAVFLASDAAGFIVGEMIHANGGEYMA